MLLGSDDNDNKLFGAEGGDSPKEEPNPSGFGKDKLFDNSGNNDISADNDDLVTDSFMLSMKANDPESVSEKLKDTVSAAESAADSAPLFNDNAAPSSSDIFGDDDELSNFEFDSSISAFKPLSGAAPAAPVTPAPAPAPAPAPEPAAPKAEETKPEIKAEEPKAPVEEKKPETIEPPLFIDDDPDFKAFAEGNEDPFKAGEDLDFAMSSKSEDSSFKSPDPLDDLELDEEALAISPFKPKNAPVAEAPKKEEPVAAPVAPVAPAAPAEPEVKAPEAKAPETAETKDKEPAEKPNMHTYGNVKSGVNAFGKKNETPAAPKAETAKEEPKAAPAPKAAPKSPFNKGKTDAAKAAPRKAPAAPSADKAPAAPKSEPVKEEPKVAPAPKAEPDPAAYPPKSNTAPMPRPIPPAQRLPEKPAPAAAQPKAVPPVAQRPAPQNAVVNQRPGAAPEAKPKAQSGEPSPFAPKGAAPAPTAGTRPAATSRPAAKQPPRHSTTQNIQPVTPVSKGGNKPEKARGGKGKIGIIILVVAFLTMFLVILGLENYDKIFPKAETTVTTEETSVEETTTTTVEETTTTTEATTTTTEATTEETTTEETTTEETTEETTTEETTTVETTTEATEATTTTTAAPASDGSSASYRYSIANPHSNGSEFSFDLVITNTGNGDSSFAGSVDHMDITFSLTPEVEITSISSDYYTFTPDANSPYTFHGTPTSGTVPAGGALNTTITCTTTEPVQHFYITNYHFELK